MFSIVFILIREKEKRRTLTSCLSAFLLSIILVHCSEFYFIVNSMRSYLIYFQSLYILSYLIEVQHSMITFTILSSSSFSLFPLTATESKRNILKMKSMKRMHFLLSLTGNEYIYYR